MHEMNPEIFKVLAYENSVHATVKYRRKRICDVTQRPAVSKVEAIRNWKGILNLLSILNSEVANELSVLFQCEVMQWEGGGTKWPAYLRLPSVSLPPCVPVSLSHSLHDTY